MPSSNRRSRAALMLVVGLLASLIVTGTGSSAVAADKGLVNGSITCPKLSKCPGLKMLWFDAGWNYLGQKKANGGGYSLTLAPGTYHVQFVDQRPAYDVSKFAPTDVKVTVRSNQLTKRNLTMQKGAAVTGTARGGGKGLGGATIYAANRAGQSYPTTANRKGQYAVGGLPQGKYSLFTYDKRKVWVGKSTWAGTLKPGTIKNTNIKLPTRAGNLTLYLFQPNGLLRTKTTLTITSKRTGQWWSATSGSGTFLFKGLYPGEYRVQFNGAGVWFAKTGTVERASVRSGRMDFGSFHLTKRGGWITGTLVDGGEESTPLLPAYNGAKGAEVMLFNSSGDKIASTTSDADGNFKITGQLATQSGLKISINPGVDTAGYMRGEGYCHFDPIKFPEEFALSTGVGTPVDPLPVPRTAGQEDPKCVTENGKQGARRQAASR